MMKKGQVTIFIIIGVLIVVTAFSIYYVSNSINAPEIGTQQGQLDVTAIEEYVTSCLDRATTEALYLVGKQGGYLYESGLSKCDNATSGEDFNMYCYGIVDPVLIDDAGWRQRLTNILNTNSDRGRESSFSLDQINSIPNPFAKDSQYPWPGFPYRDGERTFYSPGDFGFRKFPFFGGLSEQIEKYVDEEVRNCINLSVFKEQGLEITGGGASTTVDFAPEGVIARLEFPLEISNLNEKAELKEFITMVPLRMREIYSFTSDIITKDIWYADFDIKSASGERFVVTTDEYIGGDDKVIVTDTLSNLNGDTYIMQFLRENRKPALFSGIESCEQVISNPSNSYVDPDEDDLVGCWVSNGRLIITDTGGDSDCTSGTC